MSAFAHKMAGGLHRVTWRPSRSLLSLVGIAVAALAIGGTAGYFAGHAIGDNSGEINALNGQVASLHSQNSDLQSQNSTLHSQNSDLQSQNSTLQSKNSVLQSEAAAVAPASSRASSSKSIGAAAAAGQIAFGHGAAVGDLVLTPVSFTKTSSSGQSDTWTLTTTVKNNGSSSVDPFCGDTGASMTDTQGRSYDGQSVLFTGTPNCGNSVQPGLTTSGYQMKFQVPPGDTPASLDLWGTLENQDSAQTWATP
jgi:hypothetical protein